MLDAEYLSQTQVVFFQKAWEGQSYVGIAIATGYDHGYIKDIGAQLWKLLASFFGKKVTKSNFRNVISGLSHQLPSTEEPLDSVNSGKAHQSWDEAVNVVSFYGRAASQKWLSQSL